MNKMGVKIYNEVPLQDIRKRIRTNEELQEALELQNKEHAEAIVELTNLISMIAEGGTSDV